MEQESNEESLSTGTNEYCNKDETKDFDEDMKNGVYDECDVREPEVGMMFDTTDDLLEYYIKYGNKKGFPVKKRSSARGSDGEVRWFVIACSRSGQTKTKSKNSFKRRPSSKTNCKAQVRAVLCPEGKWEVTYVSLEHNHLLSPGKSRYYKINRVMRSYVKRRLEVNDRAGVRPNKSYGSFVVEAGGHENVPFLEKDCRNYLDKVKRLRLGEGDALAIHNYFLKMQANNSEFFYLMDLDKEGRLKNVFWADARSRAAYEEFGDAVTFDTTYLTNKYDMPFAPFVGVNHHGHSTLFGCGLISNEDVDTFTWLFESWLSCMDGRAPVAIITDQDKAMKKAIEKVFPNARHRWCLWHIMKKLPEKLRGYNQYETIKFTMQNVVYDSLSTEVFERGWKSFIEKFNLEDNDWLISLYNERRRWVPAFVKNTFWAGMSTTQRSESMHSFFDDYVNSRTSLKQFVEQYENALRSKVQKENHDDFNSFNSWIPCITRYKMEKQVQDAYTTAKFKDFQSELTNVLYCRISLVIDDCGSQWYDISEDMVGGTDRQATFKVCFDPVDCDVKCNCNLFEFKGILCCHAITVLLQNKIHNLPEKYIIRRWRKDVKRCHTKVKIMYSDWALNPENERFDKMCNAFYEAADLASNNEDKTTVVMRWIKLLINELKKYDGVSENRQPTSLEINQVHTSSDGGDINLTRESGSIRSPLAVRGKGRPRSTRLHSKLEQVIKKKKDKNKKEKEKEKVSQVSSQFQSQDPSAVQSQDPSSVQSHIHSQVLSFQPKVQSQEFPFQPQIQSQDPPFQPLIQPQVPPFQPHIQPQVTNIQPQVHSQVPPFQYQHNLFPPQLSHNHGGGRNIYKASFSSQMQGYNQYPFWSPCGLNTNLHNEQVNDDQ